MLHIVVDRGPAGGIQAFSVRGHAGAAARGHDIVCAGVSALAQTAVLGLQRRLGIGVAVTAGDGTLTCRLPERLSPELAMRAEDLLESVYLGFAAIASAYPRHVALSPGRRGGRGTAAAARAAADPPWAGQQHQDGRPRPARRATRRGLPPADT